MTEALSTKCTENSKKRQMLNSKVSVKKSAGGKRDRIMSLKEKPADVGRQSVSAKEKKKCRTAEPYAIPQSNQCKGPEDTSACQRRKEEVISCRVHPSQKHPQMCNEKSQNRGLRDQLSSSNVRKLLIAFKIPREEPKLPRDDARVWVCKHAYNRAPASSSSSSSSSSSISSFKVFSIEYGLAVRVGRWRGPCLPGGAIAPNDGRPEKTTVSSHSV